MASGDFLCTKRECGIRKRGMKRYKAFLKQTWWLWSLYLVVAGSLIAFVGPVFWAVIPMMVVNFFYFAIVRYDDDGTFLGA